MIGKGTDPVPYWERFRTEALTVHPEWAPFFVGALSGPGIYGEGDRRFFLEIPSQHPTIRDPLTVEIADAEPGGSIDLYWGEYFEHVFTRKDIPAEEALLEQFSRAFRAVEEWMDESRVFSVSYEASSGRRVRWGRLDFPLTQEVKARASARNLRIVYWSWLGSRDGEWVGGATED